MAIHEFDLMPLFQDIVQAPGTWKYKRRERMNLPPNEHLVHVLQFILIIHHESAMSEGLTMYQ